MVFGECGHVVFAGTKFYAAEDGFGIRSFDGATWKTEYSADVQFTSAISVNGIPVFGTAEGQIIYGPLWQTVDVGVGKIHMSYSNKMHVALSTPDTVETFSGNLLALVSEGSTVVDGFTVTDLWYDADKQIVVISAYATDDHSPVFFNCKNGVWTLVFSDLDTYAVSLASGAVATGNALYTTKNYVDFKLLHTFDGFEVRDLIYA